MDDIGILSKIVSLYGIDAEDIREYAVRHNLTYRDMLVNAEERSKDRSVMDKTYKPADMLKINSGAYNVYLLDLNVHLSYIERMIKPYVAEDPVGLYIVGKRYPINDRVKLYTSTTNELLPISINLDLVTNESIVDVDGAMVLPNYMLKNRDLVDTKPHYPIRGAEFLVELIYVLQNTINPHANLYYEDLLKMTNVTTLLPTYIRHIKTTEMLIRANYPDMPVDEVIELDAFVESSLIPLIVEYIRASPTSLYSVDITGENVRIVREDDVRSVRYDLACETYGDVTEMKQQEDDYGS